MISNTKALEEQENKENEKIRPELNLEKWSIWQPASSKNKPTRRVIQRETTLPNGSRVSARVEIIFTDLGGLTTENQKNYYGLIKIWEEKGYSNKLTYLSLRRLAKVLKKKWGTNTIESLSESLTKLRITHFIWKNSYYNSVTKETLEELDPNFTILSDLKIIKRRRDGHVTKEGCYFKFHDAILANLLHNHTKPLLFDTVINFKSEVAQLLYVHLDLIFADKNRYERRTKELFEDLGLEGKEYKYPAGRKRILEKALTELQGAQLSSGVINVARLERTKGGKDYKAIFQKAPLSLESPSKRKEKETKRNIDKKLFEKLRRGIHREDLFSIYDNLVRVKTVKDLVEDAAYSAIKSALRNNDAFLREEFNVGYSNFPFDTATAAVKEKFPYDKLPAEQLKRRDFFVGAICNAVADILVGRFCSTRP
jgi:hypothetical protein